MDKRCYRPYKPDEVKYLQPLDYVSTFTWIYDTDRWRQVFANKAALKFWCVNSLEEFLSKDHRDNSDATDKYLKGIIAKFSKALESNDEAGKEPIKTVWTLYPNNSPVTINLSISYHTLQVPTSDLDEQIYPGKVVLLFEGWPIDNTVSSDLRSLEALRHVSVMVTIYDLKGHILYRNRASETELVMSGNVHFKEPLNSNECESHGCKLGFCSKSLMPYVLDRKIVEDFASTLVNSGESKTQTNVYLLKGDRIHLIHGLKVRDPVNGGEMYLICEEDVTQTVHQEKENIEYKISSKLKDEFLALSSHELKSPLHAIIGLAEQLHDDLANKINDLESFKNISLIIESGKRMSLLVNDILDLARLTRSDVVLHTSMVNVNSMVASVLDLAKPILRGIKHANAVVDLINDVPNDVFVKMDRHRMHQVLQNLVSNSIKFTNWERSSNYIRINAERIHYTKLVDPSFMFYMKEEQANISEYWLLLTTMDSGMGIPKSVQKKIFEPFVSNIDEASRKDYGVTGLGLAITKKLVELHGGHIMVTSQGIPGLGASFHLLLPHCTNGPPKENLPLSPVVTQVNGIVTAIPSANTKSPEIAQSKGKRVALCVDDDPINQRILCNILFKNGFQPIQAMNGCEALDALKEMRDMPDIILLDIMMPGIDGFEVCKIIRREYAASQVPIIFLSANNQREIIEKGYEVGADAFFSKPFDKAELLKLVVELLGKDL